MTLERADDAFKVGIMVRQMQRQLEKELLLEVGKLEYVDKIMLNNGK